MSSLIIRHHIGWIGLLYVASLALCLGLIVFPIVPPAVGGIAYLLHFGFLIWLSWTLPKDLELFTPAAQKMVAVGLILSCLYLCSYFIEFYADGYSWSKFTEGGTFTITTIVEEPSQ